MNKKCCIRDWGKNRYLEANLTIAKYQESIQQELLSLRSKGMVTSLERLHVCLNFCNSSDIIPSWTTCSPSTLQSPSRCSGVMIRSRSSALSHDVSLPLAWQVFPKTTRSCYAVAVCSRYEGSPVGFCSSPNSHLSRALSPKKPDSGCSNKRPTTRVHLIRFLDQTHVVTHHISKPNFTSSSPNNKFVLQRQQLPNFHSNHHSRNPPTVYSPSCRRERPPEARPCPNLRDARGSTRWNPSTTLSWSSSKSTLNQCPSPPHRRRKNAWSAGRPCKAELYVPLLPAPCCHPLLT